MKKSNSTKKALSAFKKLGAVVLITATTLTLAVFFTACNQTGGGGKFTPKHAITFSVDGANGTIKAKADGITETSTSPIKVEEGKTVTFTAEPSANYKVKEWKVGDTVIANNKTTTYTHTVTKPVTVKVSFEAIPPTKYTVTLTQTANGKVTASPAIPADKQVPKDTVITFTATANDGYRVKGWTLDGKPITKAGTNTEYKHTVTGPATITVSFESNGTTPTPPAPNVQPVEGAAVLILSPNKLTIKVSAKTADGTSITVEGCTIDMFESGYTKTTLTATGTRVVLKGNITELNCSGTSSENNQLLALNVQGLSQLQELDCNHNKLAELGVQGLTSLRELNCSFNELPAIDLKGLNALQTLVCGHNQLTNLDVQGLNQLKVLLCQSNQLTAIGVQGCTALKTLACYANKLDADALTKILNDLPTPKKYEDARAELYTEQTGVEEGNCKDFTQPESLKTALKGARLRTWKLKRIDESGQLKDI